MARIAGSAHGVVTLAQLLRAGITRAEIKQRIRTGALLREHRGAYRVGHRAPSVEARYLAAVRACGEHALLSGLAAAHLLGLLRGPPPPPEVTTTTERRVAGVVTRRSRYFEPRDATSWRRIPVTSVARTLVDLAARLAVDDLARACHEAGVRHGATPAEVDAVLARRPNTRGARQLRQVLRGEIRVTLSKPRIAISRTFAGSWTRAPRDQPSSRWSARRLPVAGPSPDRRARQLPVSPFAPRVGAGSATRTRGARPRRRVSPLHVRGRLREPRTDARGAARPASSGGAVALMLQ